MHPIERLRFVARAGTGVPEEELAAEAAMGLAGVAEEDPAAAVVAARQLLSRYPDSEPLRAVVSRLLIAPDVWEEAMRCVGELEGEAAPGVPGH